ncbi:hypothetical protein CHLRE_03g199750v5 [Chlamydomonas reinhardtii]|uniref:Rhodanese domain-containing protein n=1 Tax=Chlamydomonas reinhardtii TaxID=3055 RepID=A0A2K3DZG5_CHLRE|nr:uncharacterized protein CHLRE_03g199750v5 [Chlamydomonas reinhardtii]PNW85925.1 hypothetical protein CHLRE_03g199750v5 [Chlamydomonas reinhardtii]
MPVVNVGGPVAWGLVVLVSAWAVRAGRALAGRRKARRNEEEDTVVHDPNALQPRFLQHLSATAIRMLIETGALPCAILELAPDGTPTSASAGGRANCPGQQAGGGGPGRQGAAAGSPSTAAAGGRPGGNTAASAGSGGGAAAAAGAAGGGAAGLALQRIVPPELAAAVPCMTAAAWVRALAGPEPWRAELTRAANVAAAAAGVAGAGSPGAAGSSVRSSYASSYASSLGRDGGIAGGLGAGGTTAAGLRARLPQQQAQRLSLTLGAGGTALAHNGYGGGALGQGAAGMGLEGAVGGNSGGGSAAAAGDRRLSAAGESGTDAVGPLGAAGVGPGTGYGLNQYGGGGTGSGGPLHQHGAAATAAAAVNGNAALTAAVAAAAAAAAANMASLPYPPRHALLVVLGRNDRHVAAVTAAAAAAGYSRVATWIGGPEAFAATSLGGPRLPSISKHALWLVLQLGPDPLFHVPATVIDVRRPDERLSYGAIRGTINIPADELAAALVLPPADFRQRYGVPRPSGPAEDVVVLLSRSGRRAAWAAQLCVDAGLRRVFVYGEGVYGWRLEDRVKPYRAYDLGALPPDPEPFTVEEADEAAGLEELHALDMPLRQGPRPSRFAVASPAALGGPGAAGGGARGGLGVAMGMGLGIGHVGGMLPPLPAGMAYTGGGLGGMGMGMPGGPGRGGGAAPGGPGAGHHSRGGSGAAREWGWRGRSMR